MPTIDWNLTIDTIKAGKCILFLGPEAFTDPAAGRLENKLLEYLNIQNEPGTKVYSDGLFFFRERQKRTETYLKIRRFFAEEEFPSATALFEKVARIPFHFIVTVSPDTLLLKTFETLKIKVKSGFYWKKHVAEGRLSVPTVAQPLVYNMLGSVERPESLVLTHDDLFDYLESIFQAQSMPETLRDHIINEAQSIIFLGIPFDRWYMQLLLRVLHLHKDEEFMRFAARQEMTEEIETLCKEQFKINFVPDNIEQFIGEIYRRFEAEGALREVGGEQVSMITRLKGLVASDRMEDVLQQFTEWLQGLEERGQELLDDVLLLSSRNRRLERKVTQGILSTDEAGLETNRIRSSLLNLLNEAKTLE